MKLQLTIDGGTLSGRSFELESGFLTVGRGDNCSIRFDPQTERIASKQHAFIEAKPDGFYVTDNKSTNGTLVNGQKVQTSKLNSGDRLQFGTNGATATVKLQGQTFAAPPPSAAQSAAPNNSFRDFQISQFNQAAQKEPVSVQNSLSQMGLGNVQIATQKNQTGKYVGIGVTIFAIIFLALIVCLIMFASVGIGAAIAAAFVAFIPAMFYLLPLVWLDRYDPEPLWLLALAFTWGALVSVIVSFVINTLFGVFFGSTLGAIISAPIIEEGSKGFGLILILLLFRREFDDILDGIVYAGVIALGFATVENVLYYGRGIATGGSGELVLLFIIRGIFSPFAHVTFTSMTGIGCGISRESHKTWVKLLLPLLGYFCAIVLHATWNTMASIAGLEGFAIGYFILEVPFFLIFVGFAFYIMRRQNKILNEMLAIDVARGMIPPEHVKTATSAFKSTSWLLGGIFNGKFLPRNRYLRAMGKLGLSYWHIQRATAAHGQTASFQQNPILREEVLKWRDQV